MVNSFFAAFTKKLYLDYFKTKGSQLPVIPLADSNITIKSNAYK